MTRITISQMLSMLIVLRAHIERKIKAINSIFMLICNLRHCKIKVNINPNKSFFFKCFGLLRDRVSLCSPHWSQTSCLVFPSARTYRSAPPRLVYFFHRFKHPFSVNLDLRSSKASNYKDVKINMVMWENAPIPNPPTHTHFILVVCALWLSVKT